MYGGFSVFVFFLSFLSPPPPTPPPPPLLFFFFFFEIYYLVFACVVFIFIFYLNPSISVLSIFLKRKRHPMTSATDISVIQFPAPPPPPTSLFKRNRRRKLTSTLRLLVCSTENCLHIVDVHNPFTFDLSKPHVDSTAGIKQACPTDSSLSHIQRELVFTA